MRDERHPLCNRPATWLALIVGFFDLVSILACFGFLIWLLRCVVTGKVA